MKINKLFHWLYALIMLLPIGYIGGFTLYSVFNKNAYLSNSITETQPQVELNIQYEYQTEEVNSYSDIDNQHVYYCADFSLNGIVDEYDLIFDIAFVKFTSLSFETTNWSDMQYNETDFFYPYQSNLYNRLILSFDTRELTIGIRVQISEDDFIDVRNVNLDSFDEVGIYVEDAYFIPIVATNNFVNYCIDTDYLEITSSDYLGAVTDVSYSLVPGNPGTLDNAFNYALENLNNLPFFAWSSNTFFSAPFNYIANLFGIASNNPICSLLSYWFSISVIWLVFDVMLYVPLLVHRWLDKASIS